MNNCTECQFDSEVCGMPMGLVGHHVMSDKDGEFCIRCGHAPECHGKSEEV